MAISVEVGDFVHSDGGVDTTTQDVTVGFDPKALIIWGTNRTSTGDGQDDLLFSYGFCDDSDNNNCTAGRDEDGVGNMNNVRIISNQVYYKFNITADTKSSSATCALGTAKFTLTWTTADSGTEHINYIAFGGADITGVQCGETGQPLTDTDLAISTDADCQSATAGSAAVFTHGSGQASLDSIGNNTSFSAGFGTDPAVDHGFCSWFGGDNGEATAEWNNAFRNTRIIHLAIGNTAAVVGEAYLKEYTASGFTLTFSNTDGNARYVAWMIIKGGQWDSGTDTVATTTTTKATTTDFQPKCVMALITKRTTFGASSNIDVSWNFGASDDTNEVASGCSGNDGPTTMENGKQHSETHLIRVNDVNTPATNLVQGQIISGGSMNATDFTVDYTTADGTAYPFIWIVCGDNASAGGFAHSKVGAIIG